MAQRSELHALLVSLLGTNHVYFQPPPGIQLHYPCMIYERSDEDAEHANNKPYKRVKRYQVTVIDTNPDSLLPDKVADIPMTSYNRFYASDNLNHDVFSIYF